MPKPTGERRPKRVCQVCLQYDDHPRIELLVTADGPLGLHEPGEVSQVAAMLAPLLPANSAQVDAGIQGVDPADAERNIAELIPDLDERDAYKAWRAFLHVNDFGAHLDCYVGLPAEVQPQLALNDTRKIMPNGHAMFGVGQGLKGDDLAAHLQADPARDVDNSHGVKS